MSMSKKDFIELADVIRKPGMLPASIAEVLKYTDVKGADREDVCSRIMCVIAEDLADFCQSQNGQFKRDRWLSYIAGECGPNGGAVKSK